MWTAIGILLVIAAIWFCYELVTAPTWDDEDDFDD